MAELMTTREVAHRFGVNRATVTRWHIAGLLVGRRLASKALLFDRADVDRFAARRHEDDAS